jgi:hypothetical protein
MLTRPIAAATASSMRASFMRSSFLVVGTKGGRINARFDHGQLTACHD